MAKRRRALSRSKSNALVPTPDVEYSGLISGISELLERARRTAGRAVNSILTATYWEIGRRIVEFEQGGKPRAEYGEQLLERLARDLAVKHGRGFSVRNVWNMKAFYLGWEILQTPSAEFEARSKCSTPSSISRIDKILQTVSAESAAPPICPTPSGISDEISQTLSAKSGTGAICQTLSDISGDQISPTPPAKSQLVPTGGDLSHILTLAEAFPLSWSQYVRLMALGNTNARAFYEVEAIRGGWSVRQLDRQIGSLFYERTALSKRKAAMLQKGRRPRPEEAVSVQDELRDPYLLEFLDLKDEYSESDLEEALIRHMETFLLELGTGFAFVARQKRIRIGDTWYRIDLLLYHRGLRCLVIIDLKIDKFTHADSGQMNLYLNYAKEHLTMPSEADPIGLILCTDKDDAVVKYAIGGINTQVFASKYLVALPDEETLRQEILATQRALAARTVERKIKGPKT